MEQSLLTSSFRAASSLSARRRLQLLSRTSICARCLLHSSATKEATPVAHPTVAGPPPEAPQAAVSYPKDRVARKQQQADLLRQGQDIRAGSKPGSALQKRFWKNVSVKENEEGGLQILLDSKPVRTASRQVLTIPKHKRALATSIALEWDQLVSAQQALKQHYVPMTSITSRAMDIEAADQQGNTNIRQNVVKMALRYLGTDTLLCWAPEKSLHDPMAPNQSSMSLRQRQKAMAQPIIAFLTTHIFPGIEIVEILSEDSIMPRAQPEMTTEVIRGWLSGLPPYELAALERAVLATKSLLVAVRLLVDWSPEWKHLRKTPENTGRFGIAQAAEAATLEVLHQTEQWGEVEDTHDVEKEDMRRQLGSAIILVS